MCSPDANVSASRYLDYGLERHAWRAGTTCFIRSFVLRHACARKWNCPSQEHETQSVVKNRLTEDRSDGIRIQERSLRLLRFISAARQPQCGSTTGRGSGTEAKQNPESSVSVGHPADSVVLGWLFIDIRSNSAVPSKYSSIILPPTNLAQLRQRIIKPRLRRRRRIPVLALQLLTRLQLQQPP